MDDIWGLGESSLALLEEDLIDELLKEDEVEWIR